MNANSLLLWMSARGEGSWPQFRSAVEELHLSAADAAASPPVEEDESSGLSIYWSLRLNMQRFGHAEFAAGAGGRDWRVTPPTIALNMHAGRVHGVLVGARSDRLLAQIAEAAGHVHLEMDTLPLCPDVIRVQGADQDALRGFADVAGLCIQPHAPTAILLCLPPIDDRSTQRATEIPIGRDWNIERFSARRLSWTDSSRDEVSACRLGLFRFSLRYQKQVILCTRRTSLAVPGQVGKYAVLRHRRRWVLHYDAARQCLSMPASCRPPFLVERALILCSGALPRFEARTGSGSLLHYYGVPFAVAKLAAGVLRQELQSE